MTHRLLGSISPLQFSSSLLQHAHDTLNIEAMKLLSLLLTILPLALAAKHLSTVIVTYPPDTPASAIDQDMKDIVDAVCQP